MCRRGLLLVFKISMFIRWDRERERMNQNGHENDGHCAVNFTCHSTQFTYAPKIMPWGMRLEHLVFLQPIPTRMHHQGTRLVKEKEQYKMDTKFNSSVSFGIQPRKIQFSHDRSKISLFDFWREGLLASNFFFFFWENVV